MSGQSGRLFACLPCLCLQFNFNFPILVAVLGRPGPCFPLSASRFPLHGQDFLFLRFDIQSFSIKVIRRE